MEYGLWRIVLHPLNRIVCGLNPCSNGIWSLTYLFPIQEYISLVLILVLMEYGLWHESEIVGYDILVPS